MAKKKLDWRDLIAIAGFLGFKAADIFNWISEKLAESGETIFVILLIYLLLKKE
ncbi:MAG: hypothetical protein ABH851_09010 [Methanobacteriota archaeon]